MLKSGHFLAFDTSTDVMSIALTNGSRVWQHSGPGGAQASSHLIPAILRLLEQADLALGDLRAIVFGRGPGSFSGLRTACAVAQGLAFGANHGLGVPVLPIDTLLAVAEEARFQSTNDVHLITALLDARMDEMYMQRYALSSGALSAIGHCELIRPEDLVADSPSCLFAGNVFTAYESRLPAGILTLSCLPTATALLRLAPGLAASGQCVPADQALPLYVRDKVAFTTEERAAISKAKDEAKQAQPATEAKPVA